MRPKVPHILLIGDDEDGNLTTDVMLQCCVCLHTFSVGDPQFVTTANKQPVCSKCVLENNPKRVANGLLPMPFDPRGYK